MKRLIFALSIFGSVSANAQFMVSVEAPSDFSSKDAILYTLSGSKDIIYSKESKKGNKWSFKVNEPYTGMMKLYFPETNNTVNFISENKDVKLQFSKVAKDKIKKIDYLDASNDLMNRMQDVQQKKEVILQPLYEIKEYYADESDFGKALLKEIDRLSLKNSVSASEHPFIDYYSKNYQKFLVKDPSQKGATAEDLTQFILNSNQYLETSSLMRPILIAYLNSGPSQDADSAISKLLTDLKPETPRGQTVLSELIEIFDVYGMGTLKEKYLGLAKNLKCTITDRLASTLKANAQTEVGSVFPGYTFRQPLNTSEKKLENVKAAKKVVVVWSSTCSHCEEELPKLLEKYGQLKAQNIQVIGLSIDTDKDSYQKKASVYPWINDTELQGWNSTFVDLYNVHATPSYFILDSNNKIISKPDHVGDVLKDLNLK